MSPDSYHDLSPELLDQLQRARAAGRVLAGLTDAAKSAGLIAMADALLADQADIVAANQTDLAAGRAAGLSDALLDRLALSPDRVAAMADGLRTVASLTDPIGQIVAGWDLANGVHIERRRVPFGVIAVIYEARPNVTADTAGLCLKAGNAAVLRGSSSAIASNRAIAAALRTGLASAGLPPDAVSLVEGGHEATEQLMRARGLLDLLIPRGGASLIQAVVTGAQVPVIETGTGNCHLFIDASADRDQSLAVMLNAKTQRPSVCNALETMLVHADIATTFLPAAVDALVAAGVTVHGDAATCALDDRVVAAGPDWDSEQLSLDLRVAIVADLDTAIGFIQAHSTGHSETIMTNDLNHQRRFCAEIDAAAVLVNASSRFVDGGQFGFGAEIGISTQKLHARGPMGPTELTTTKYVVSGNGQVRA